MSAVGRRRPAAGGLRRVPRGDRVADQMAANGVLIRADNSDVLYKAALIELSETYFGRSLGWVGSLERLERLERPERRELLCGASVLWCAAVLSVLARASAVPPAPGRYGRALPDVVAAVLGAVGHRLRLISGLSGRRVPGRSFRGPQPEDSETPQGGGSQ